jgi:hypothetical protein
VVAKLGDVGGLSTLRACSTESLVQKKG